LNNVKYLFTKFVFVSLWRHTFYFFHILLNFLFLLIAWELLAFNERRKT
jgi:hypothetical protein